MIPNGPRSLGKNFAIKIKGGHLPLDLVFISFDNFETQRNAGIVGGLEGEGTCEEGVLTDFDLERDCVDRTVCILTNDRVPRGRGGEDFLGDRIFAVFPVHERYVFRGRECHVSCDFIIGPTVVHG